jgi:hypothetical protein
MKIYTHRRRKETFNWVQKLTWMLIQSRGFHSPRQAETARRLAVETWLQKNGVITITQKPKVLPVFSEKFAHN